MATRVIVGMKTMWLETCCHDRCKTSFAMSDELHAIAMERREDFKFYCPNGHSQWYANGEAEIERIRRERDRLKQQLAEKDDAIRYQREQREAAERRVSAARGQITKLKKRASNGVCPCCGRTFSDLARHMHSKHPGFVTEPDATEHVH